MRASLSYKQALQRMSTVMDVRQYDAFQAATMLHDFFDGDRDEILHDLLTARAKKAASSKLIKETGKKVTASLIKEMKRKRVQA